METKVEIFQESSYSGSLTLPANNGVQEGSDTSNKPITATNGSNVALNLCPDGSEISISINGTTVHATKTSLKATIGKFTISIGYRKAYDPLPSVRALISVTQGTPLHIIRGDPPEVSATISFSEVPTDDLVNVSSNGQGSFFLSAINNTHYLAVDSDNSIQVLPEPEDATSTNISRFMQEDVPGVVAQRRYFTEANGERYYLIVTSEGEVTTIHADDLVIGSQNDFSSRFWVITS